MTCEEYDNGQVWEVDPWGNSTNRKTVIGGPSGMSYESAAYDNRDPMNPAFYLTVDESDGPLIKFTPPSSAVLYAIETNDYSNLLHSTESGSKYEYFRVTSFNLTTGNGTYEWTKKLKYGQASATLFHAYGEGIDSRNGKLFYTTKAKKFLLIIDLDDGTFVRSSTKSGAFDAEPDQVARILDGSDDNSDDDSILYFCEDGGDDCGVHGRNAQGQFFTILKDSGGFYGGETTGLAFSPNGMFMYVSFQSPGHIFEIRRTDGLPFQGQILDIKYHEMTDDDDDNNDYPFVRQLHEENEKTCDVSYEFC